MELQKKVSSVYVRLKKIIKANHKTSFRVGITMYYISVISYAINYKNSLNGKWWLFVTPTSYLIYCKISKLIKKNHVRECVVEKQKMHVVLLNFLNQILFAFLVYAVYPKYGQILLWPIITIFSYRYYYHVLKNLGISKIQIFILVTVLFFLCWIDIGKLTILTTIYAILMYVLDFENLQILVKLFFNIEILDNLQNRQMLAKYNFISIYTIFLIIVTAYIIDGHKKGIFKTVYFKIYGCNNELDDEIINFLGKGIDKILLFGIILAITILIYEKNKEKMKGLIIRTFVSRIDDGRK